ncbi:hypothetical protein [Candidatus Nitrosocosmicus arcticus]|uniref:Uncharacterized protein n=1 Tax=Candidatus Nitrosocosmicus arcticus TaxID=2035267 RepID=A0A557SRG6_9ARCH|nr:hypothetical protein [Candidatus Nitrosocosmicus arcticus]TVP39193.1 hypothetical protein NARC_180004 [Candidatus Nitrosocosmicus arcticus]
MLLKDQPEIKKHLDQLDNLFKGLDDESIKRKQTIEKLINDYRQKNQELLDHIDSEYSDPQQKEILLRILQYNIIGSVDEEPIKYLVEKLT